MIDPYDTAATMPKNRLDYILLLGNISLIKPATIPGLLFSSPEKNKSHYSLTKLIRPGKKAADKIITFLLV
jgi:hypothetical protein